MNKESVADWPSMDRLLIELGAVLAEPVAGGEALDGLVVDELLLLLMAIVPFELDGQNFPVCCRQLNCVNTSGSTAVPSDRLTKSRKASFAMDPPRGSCRDGHMIQGKPCEPLKLRCVSTANPFLSSPSNSMGVLMTAVPSRSRPFFAANCARAACPAAVLNAAGV